MKTIYPDPWEFTEQQLALPRSREEAIQRKQRSYLPYDDASGAFQSCEHEHRSAFDIEGRCRKCEYDTLVASYNRADNVKARAERKAVAEQHKKAAQIEYPQRQAKAKAERKARHSFYVDERKKAAQIEYMKIRGISEMNGNPARSTQRDIALLASLPDRFKWAGPILIYRPACFNKKKPAKRKHWIDSYGRVPLKADVNAKRAAL